MLVSVRDKESVVNLASLEAKKEDTGASLQLYQRLKNHRINSAILNRANYLVGTTDISCIYIDIVGPCGYLVQLTRHTRITLFARASLTSTWQQNF
jgi:hypothetical protein